MDKIREIVAMFMENDYEFTKLEGKSWYDMEDKLVGMITDNMIALYTAIEHEYATDDVIQRLYENDLPYDDNELVEKIVNEYERMKMKYGGEEDDSFLVEAIDKITQKEM